MRKSARKERNPSFRVRRQLINHLETNEWILSRTFKDHSGGGCTKTGGTSHGH